MAKVKKSVDIGARERWEKYLLAANIGLTGPQQKAADAFVSAINEGGDDVFWNGQTTGKSYLWKCLSECFD